MLRFFSVLLYVFFCGCATERVKPMDICNREADYIDPLVLNKILGKAMSIKAKRPWRAAQLSR